MVGSEEPALDKPEERKTQGVGSPLVMSPKRPYSQGVKQQSGGPELLQGIEASFR